MKLSIVLTFFLILSIFIVSCKSEQHENNETIQQENQTSTVDEVAEIKNDESLIRGAIPINAPALNKQYLSIYEGSYALLIGVSDYDANTGWQDLPTIPDEMTEVKSILQRSGFEVQLVSNPNSKTLNDTITHFAEKYGKGENNRNNRLLFFFAGHGFSENSSDGYFVPTDAPSPQIDSERFKQKAIRLDSLKNFAEEYITAKHVLYLFDSCFSGAVFLSRGLTDKPEAICNDLANSVRWFITSGSADQAVPAKSTFVPAFIKAIRDGKADYEADGFITGSELALYLYNNVKNNVQTPQYGKSLNPEFTNGDFVFLNLQNQPDDSLSTLLAENICETIPEISIPKKEMPKRFRSAPKRFVNENELKYMLTKNNFFDGRLNRDGKGVTNGFKEVNISGDSVIFDEKNGLMWNKSITPKPLTLREANDYLQKLNKHFKLGNHNDWRIPTLEEAMTLIEPQKQSNKLHTNAPIAKSHHGYSNLITVDEVRNLSIIFGLNGKIDYSPKNRRSLLLAVRTFTSPTAFRTKPAMNLTENAATKTLLDNNFYDNMKNKTGIGAFENDYKWTNDLRQTITDENSGLMWIRSSKNRASHSGALEQIKELNRTQFEGYKNWRLPTLEEAMTLLEIKKMSGDLYLNEKFDDNLDKIWTADKNGKKGAWMINFRESFFGINSFEIENWVLAVRSINDLNDN